MATTYIPHLPNHPSTMPDPSYPRSHEAHYPGQGSGLDSIILGLPHHHSSDTFPPSKSIDSSSYLPTPQSGISLHHQQQEKQSHQSQSPSPYPTSTTPIPSHAYVYRTPQQGHEWQQPIAGPSAYRRSPNIASPMSASGSDVHSSGGGGLADLSPANVKKPKGRMTAQGEQVMMDSMERMAVDEGDGRVGVDEPFGERSYTELKCLGDGSFGTVWLCDWHSPVKSNVMLSAMQCGAGARQEWDGKRLVALKRMKRVWEGGWGQARNLGEIYSLSRIPQHPAIIPLYDAFISPKSRELYFVFECMEGNLYQLTKSRRGRPLAAGLIASCFHQISSGLHHIHRHGYFHRDMKPENLLVTTTGLADYLTASALNSINSARSGSGSSDDLPRTPNGTEPSRYEKDVSVIVKLADFGLARATASKPPYTEYVSTRWYRAPEVLLRSTEYGPPVDMWALGTILAEMLNLKPIFPGVSEIDQVYRITDTLGDPSSEYGSDDRKRTIGGGAWVSGIKLAKNVGFSFPKRTPVNFRGLFNEKVPQSLVDCIADLLRYNPKYRMTSAECLQHPYFHETLPHLQRTHPLPRIPFSAGQPAPGAMPKHTELNVPPRQVPPSHSHHETRPAFANGDMRTLPPPMGTPDNSSRVFFPQTTATDRFEPSALVNQLRELDLPTEDLHSYGHRAPPSPVAGSVYSFKGEPAAPAGPAQRTRAWAEDTSRRASNAQPGMYDGSVYEGSPDPSASNTSFSQFTLSQNNRHVMSQTKVAHYVQAQQQVHMYEDGTPRQPGQKLVVPPPIEATQGATLTVPSPGPSHSGKLGSVSSGKKKKWGLSSVFGGGDKSVSSLAPVDELAYPGSASSSLKRTQSGNPPPVGSSMASLSDDPKAAKKEAEKARREAEKLKRETAARVQKERARAVMIKRQQLLQEQQRGKDPQLEFTSGFTVAPEVPRNKPGIYPASGMSHHDSPTPPTQMSSQQIRDARTISYLPASQSATSIRCHESPHSGHASIHSEHSHSQPQLPIPPHHTYDMTGRRKARRRDEDDDHSMSSFDHNSLRSRSVLTVGTVDSDPGPRRGRIDFSDPHGHYSKDPLFAKRAPSVSSFHHAASRLASISNPSLESQLAHDFMAHATMASTSTASLCQHGSPNGQYLGQGSAPTSPYGHPKAMAVSQGAGMGRSQAGGSGGGGMMLPSISGWEEGHEGIINPMFKVPPAEGQTHGTHGHRGQTLPPFSDIARIADWRTSTMRPRGS